MSLDDAIAAFAAARTEPRYSKQLRKHMCNRAAGRLLETLMQYEADGMIGDDTFLNNLAAIADYLKE